MIEEPVFTAEMPGLGFVVYGDRIEATVKRRVQVIPLSSVTSVVVSPRPKKLVVETVDGKHYQYLLGRDTEPARGAIAGRLPAVRAAGS